MRPSRESIIEQLHTCVRDLGKTPGREAFVKKTGIKERDMNYYWPRFSDLVREAGYTPNEMNQLIPEDELFQALARACLCWNKFPTTVEYRIAARELDLPNDKVYTARYGSIVAVKARFKQWLETGPNEHKRLLELPGWETSSLAARARKNVSTSSKPDPSGHPFLPVCLQYLDLLSRGTKPYTDFAENVNTAFEKGVADAFVCLGFDVQKLGQGRGRNADCLALSRQTA